MTYDPESLLGRLQTLPDPRRRQGAATRLQPSLAC